MSEYSGGDKDDEADVIIVPDKEEGDRSVPVMSDKCSDEIAKREYRMRLLYLLLHGKIRCARDLREFLNFERVIVERNVTHDRDEERSKL